MGFYIETNSHKNKAEWLIANAKAVEYNYPMPGNEKYIPVIVINNGVFEAAGIAFNPLELDAFTLSMNDTRPRRYLLIPRSEIIRLKPSVEEHLKW